MKLNDMWNKPGFWLTTGGVIVAGAVVANAFSKQPDLADRAQKLVQFQPARVAEAGPGSIVPGNTLQSLDAMFTSLADKASQGVVHITTDLNGLDGSRSNRQMMGGEGSGFVFRTDGWIVTNDHVVSGLSKVRVILADGRELLGTVTRANDPQLDLAVVKVNADDLVALPMADSNKVRPGALAMAVGSPFSLENSVTIGHVSAISRVGRAFDQMGGGGRVYSGMIQTDAAINPGNSGGPLINTSGEVIGVNSSISTTSGGSNGIGFAIPANIVTAVAEELIANKKFDRGLLGVTPSDLKPFEKKKFGVDLGAIVREVPTNSAAYAQGIRKDDVIVQIGDVAVTNEVDLRVAMYRHSPGNSVSVTFVHGGQRKTVNVKLASPDQLVAQNEEPAPSPSSPFSFPDRTPLAPEPSPERQSEKPRLGVTVQQIDATMRTQFKLPSDANGVVVTSVADGSFAQKLGIKPGDVIQKLGDQSVASVSDVTAGMAEVQWGDQLTVKFARYENSGRQDFTVIVPFN